MKITTYLFGVLVFVVSFLLLVCKGLAHRGVL